MKLKLWPALAVALVAAVLSLAPQDSQAAGQLLPGGNDCSRTASPPDGIANCDPRLVMSLEGIGNSLDSPEGYAKIYFGSGGAQSVTIIDASFCGSPSLSSPLNPNGVDGGTDNNITRYEIYPTNANEQPNFGGAPLVGLNAPAWVYCQSYPGTGARTDLDLNFNASSSPLSVVPGHNGLRAFYLKAVISRTCNTSQAWCASEGEVNSFTLKANGGKSAYSSYRSFPRQSLAAQPLQYNSDGVLAIEDRERAPSGYPNTHYSWDLEFAPTCGTLPAGNNDGYLKWGNLEQGSAIQQADARFTLFTYNRNTGVLVRSDTYTPPNDPAIHSVQEYKITWLNENYKYVWRWSNVQRNNALQIWMPYDSGEFDFTCGYGNTITLLPATQTITAGSVANLTITVSGAGAVSSPAVAIQGFNDPAHFNMTGAVPVPTATVAPLYYEWDRPGPPSGGTIGPLQYQLTHIAATGSGSCYTVRATVTPADALSPLPAQDTAQICVVSARTPGLTAQNGDIHAGGGICKAAQSGGNVNASANSSSLGQYVVSSSGNVGGLTSNNYAPSVVPAITSNGDKLKLQGYDVACRPDLVSLANTKRSTLAYGTIGSVPLLPTVVDLGCLTNGIGVCGAATAGQDLYYYDGAAPLQLYGVVKRKITIVATHPASTVQIIGQITLSTASFPRDQLPSLGVIAANDIVVMPVVNRVDAYLFANGNIDTCNGSFCPGTLYVNGFMMSNSMAFRRTGPTGSSSSATTPQYGEVVTLTPELYLNPPRLFDDSNEDWPAEGQGERAPLF